MSSEAVTPPSNPAPESATEQPAPSSPAQETDWKAEARKWEQRAKENRSATDNLRKEIEDSQKSAEQKAAEALAAAQASANAASVRALAYEVAAEANLPLALAARLTGTTKEELLADAETLKALIPQAPEAAPTPPNGPTVPGQQPGGAQTPALVTQSDLDALGAAGKYDEINRLRREGRLTHLGIAPQKQR